MSEQKLMLIDGNSIINRAFFAIPPLNDSQGRNVNAVYGFISILLKAISDQKPNKLIVAFDKKGKNFRKELYPEYKANRKGMPEDLAAQLPILHELLDAMHVAVVEKAGIEADDIIGTICTAYDGTSVIVSGDRDMLQLVSEKTTVLLTKKGVTEVEENNPISITANYRLTPSQIVDYKALRGDTSDNIPGVQGIGDKTAMSLLERFGSLDGLYERIEELQGSMYPKLLFNRDAAYLSKTLATIVTNADIEFDLDNCPLPQADQRVKTMLEALQFRTIISRMDFSAVPEPIMHEVEQVEIVSREQLDAVIDEMLAADCVAIDFTADGVSLACSADKQYVVTVSESFLDELNRQAVFDSLERLLRSNVVKAVYDVKHVKHVLDDIGLDIFGVKYDVCLMQYLVEYRAHKDLHSLCTAYGYEGGAAGIYFIAGELNRQLEELGVSALYYDVELPLSDLLFRMEKEGVAVDVELLTQMSADIRAQLDDVTAQIYELAGERFNVNSPMQLSRILFEKLGLPHGKKTQRGYSTGSDVLECIADKHPIVGKILEFRSLSKLLGTYLDGLKPLIHGGLVHTTFNQALTSTGRLSSSDPNLQNIPVRTEQGKEIRRLFKSKHGVFVGADYSQIELRLLAAFSGDSQLLDSFRNGEDIHTRVASELLGVPQQMVTREMRHMAKAVNFGIIYGISDFGLSQNTNISMRQAKEYIDKYFARFPTIKQYLDSSVEKAKSLGYVTTITGRRRQIPEIMSNNHNLRTFGERAAMNMPLQGSAADIMKIAMLRVDEAIRAAGLKSRIVLQIHDEIIVDCFLDEAEQVKAIVKQQMEQAVTLACPLIAETEEGVTLYEA